ncbi:MAG: carotenoid oxygenase family protein [Pseudomonadota bacterium]
MPTTLIREYDWSLPEQDEHPYRTGPWRPNRREFDATDLEVDGEIPQDLAGAYIRNTENPQFPALGRYHPFDGDGMLHSLVFDRGQVAYRNRFVPTAGLAAEREAGAPLWAGLRERPDKSLRDGWGARTRLKDASSTDVVVHGGVAATSFYQCGDIYELDPRTLECLGTADWVKDITPGWGVSAHTKVDEATGEMLFFNYGKNFPYMHYGVVNAARELVHYIPIELPGPRLPHDMAFTERFAILNDLPLFWDPEALAHGAHAVRFFPELPSRFGIVPRRGQPEDVRWFDARPTYVLHWINAFEDGDEVVLDGYTQDPRKGVRTPVPDSMKAFAQLDINAIGAHAYRWRFNLRTGAVTEGPLADSISEFGMINPRVAGRDYRYTWEMTAKPGWFLFDGLRRLDVRDGSVDGYKFEDGVFASEAPMAPRIGSAAEDDGYVVTLTTDMNRDRSGCAIFAADDIASGPLATVWLPERVCVGTHSYWADESLLS